MILPIILLGLITLLSNIPAVFGINNVHANAGSIVDRSMASEERLKDIRRSAIDIHCLTLSHIVAADHAAMIRLVQEIKAKEDAAIHSLQSGQTAGRNTPAKVFPPLSRPSGLPRTGDPPPDGY